MVGEDASGAVGVVVVKVREHKPRRKTQTQPRAKPGHPIRLRHKLLKESKLFKGSK